MTNQATLTSEELDAAYQAGAAASESTDWRQHVNPFPRGTTLFRRWRDGFRDASRCVGAIDL
jgi:hypothetical protein